MPKAKLKSGVQLHYQQVGRGPDLVMVHGLTGNLAFWHLRLVPELMDRFRILTYDLRGHGYSEMPPGGYSTEAMADDLDGLLDELGIEQASLVGHSFGADISLYQALVRPERVDRVVAIEPSLPALIPYRSRDDWEGWSYWARVLEQAGLTIDPEHRSDADYLFRQTLKMPKKWGPLNGMMRKPERFLQLMDTTRLTDEFLEVGALTLDNISRIEAPVLLIYDEQSSFLESFRQLKARLPRVSPVLLPSATDLSHFGPLEQPEVVVHHLRSFLDLDGEGSPIPSVDGAELTPR